MKIRTSSTLILVTVLLAACAPAQRASPTDPSSATQPPAVDVPTETLTVPTIESETQSAPSEAAALPVATSRGPDLHATDPTTVSLASGGLQFVEFFRFT